jgi:hypothetical protein
VGCEEGSRVQSGPFGMRGASRDMSGEPRRWIRPLQGLTPSRNFLVFGEVGPKIPVTIDGMREPLREQRRRAFMSCGSLSGVV